ncbi:hypothetical protein GXP67_07310 [Rhodocytophaga rosea]|uniref:Lipocalin-like domain-containing protein n=1 Tax=Rhodocytophaga rosea TaxID=2704465 RepID=A0A6C0GET0_9BACT|nr:hypothetical protein [Rhodocytophaga rosea]QHT66476.1 hypothetical protein GXP67_07310 [Rhodocytophaga rosea]
MKKSSILLIFILALHISFCGYGQINCQRERIIGEWTEVTNMAGVHTNIDSLRNLMNNRKETLGTWNFNSDGTYTYKDSYSNEYYRKGQKFNFDNSTCEIILWSKSKSRTKKVSRENLEIIYIEHDFLVYKSDDNPKGYYTHLMKRK